MLKKTFVFALFATFAVGSVASTAHAKCFGFRDADITVCIDGNDNATRSQAEDVCESVTGDDCGGVSGYSGSCSGSDCYDGDGEQHNSLSAD